MRKIIILFFISLILVSCGEDFLNIRRDAAQVIPKTVADYQALLNWDNVMNASTINVLMCVGADEYYLRDADWNSISATFQYQKRAYIWEDDVYEGAEVANWNNSYERILYTNMVLNSKPEGDFNQTEWDKVRGQALFHRAWAYHNLVLTFCMPYRAETAEGLLGVPLKLDYDVNERPKRASLQQIYKQIVTDLLEAERLLDETVISKFSPTRSIARALLSRVYLDMADYGEALKMADKVLSEHVDFMDYNLLDTLASTSFGSYPEGKGNPEVLFYNHTSGGQALAWNRMRVDSNLYETYDSDDLRKVVFFDNTRLYKGSQVGSTLLFTGLGKDEVLLNKAECLARAGEGREAVDLLNSMLKFRYKKNKFVPLIYQNNEAALALVLQERFKQLFMRGTRWMDLRRLARYPKYAKSVTRKLNGEKYVLEPNSPKWAWPIPDNEIDLSKIPQNTR